jgi:hypothetical protein
MPLIENSCGPLINYDSWSTFDETSPFLTSPFYVIFICEYELTISSNITFLLTCNFGMEGLKHLCPFYSKEYLMKIHFLVFGSSFDILSSNMHIYNATKHSKVWDIWFLGYEFFFRCHAMNCRCGCSIHDINCNCYCFCPKLIWKILFIQHGTCYFCNVHACSSFQQFHYVVGNNYMNTSFEFLNPSNIH